MADYGKTATEYKPAAGIYTGLIGKIAEEVIRGEMVKGHFDSLIKGTFTSGKDLEVALLKRATGTAYNRTTPPKPGAPEVSVLYHTQDTARTYGVLIDDNEIQEGTISAEKGAPSGNWKEGVSRFPMHATVRSMRPASWSMVPRASV